MATHRLGIIMNGATGQLSRSQHVASLLAIRAEGGLLLSNGDRIMPDPIFVGRGGDRLKALAAETGSTRWTVDLDQALANAGDTVFFERGRDHRAFLLSCVRRRSRRASTLMPRNRSPVRPTTRSRWYGWPTPPA